ncbi:MAG: SWIM zinc finger family protein [Caldilineaceae bacterium]|nr:SWIM zinc finger family protein [Caldilineaceae bacterium]
MQSLLTFHHLLGYAARTRKMLKLYVRPTGEYRGGIAVDDGKYEVVGYRINGEDRQPCALSIDGWTAPFWRVMEENSWKVAHRQGTNGGEFVWQLHPMVEDRVFGVPTAEELLGYVDKMRPLAGERAGRALELAISGKIAHLPVADNGEDRWQVDGSHGHHYTVSIRGRSCTCPDAANGAPRWMDAPLCKHRIAVMYIHRWEEATGKRLCQQSPIYINDEGCTPSRREPEEYVTIAPPTTSKEGWRWVHVRGAGRLTLYSRQEFASQDAVLPVAQSIAQSKSVPFLYRIQGQYHNGAAQNGGGHS